MAAKVNKKIQHRIFLHCDKYLRQFHFYILFCIFVGTHSTFTGMYLYDISSPT